jgi:myo-inositol 2-dehydrogenase/D-chiro-inositol 1-dehydrogenase
MRIAVVGLGSIGRRHVRLLRERSDVAVEVVEPDAARLAKTQLELGPLLSHPNFAAMLDSAPDIVWIATPTSLHAEQAIAAFAAGAHVFCEKPMSANLADARRTADAAAGARGIFGVGFYLHFWQGIRRLREWIQAGSLGQILHAHARVGTYTTLVNSESRYQATQPGSLFFDYSHQPDLFYWLLGSVPRSVRVTGFEAGQMELSASPNVADIICDYEQRLITTIHLNYVQRPERHNYEIVGDLGWATADFQSGCVQYGDRRKDQVLTERFEQSRDDMFRAEHEAFLSAVNGERTVETSAADGLVSTAICAAALRSWQSGEQATVDIAC